MLLDGEQQLYQHYGFPRAGWWTLLKPIVTWKYLVNIFTGNLPGPAGKDIRQLGGNVLINPDGVVAMNHVSADPHDRPNAEEILGMVTAAK